MKFVVVFGVLLLLIGGAAFLYFNGDGATGATITGGSVSTAEAIPELAKSEVREITVDAARFTFTPAAIRVHEGERVRITVRNADTTHGISIPEFNVRDRESVEFVATKKGNYSFYCTTYCGSGHPDMQGTIIVE